MNRRHLLYFGLFATVAKSVLATDKELDQLNRYTRWLAMLEQDASATETTALKTRAANRGLIYGADCGVLQLDSDPALMQAVVQECGMLVAGMLKWEFMRPTLTEFEFTIGDWYAEFAREHHLLLRGHTLVWHVGLPAWFHESVNTANARQFMTEHIYRVAGHYAGQMHSWDVVNEAIEPKDGREDGLRQTPWLEFLGPGYIDLAFWTAAEADPNAMLVYNDYGIEYDRNTDEAKRKAVLKLLEGLKSREVPVHALGIQSHLQGDATDFSPAKLQQFLRDVASLGLKILITELDVSDRKLPADIAIRDRVIASVYEDYLNVVLNEPAVIAVTTWGLSDRYTWLSSFEPRPDGLPVRPLPLDENMNRKLAWYAIAHAIDNTSKR